MTTSKLVGQALFLSSKKKRKQLLEILMFDAGDATKALVPEINLIKGVLPK